MRARIPADLHVLPIMAVRLRVRADRVNLAFGPDPPDGPCHDA
jgi:hypothetical protein